MKHTPKAMVKSALQQRGYRLVRDAGQRQLISELVDWHGEAMPPRLPRRARRVELLADVQETSVDGAADGGPRGTSVSAALYLLRTLHQALATTGEVCAFGVGQGRVAALLAHEIDGTGRTLWLYDAFAGADAAEPESAAGDGVLDLSAAERSGRGGHGVQDVLDRLQAAGFPPGATRIVPGHVGAGLTVERLPRRVAFAHVGLARHQPALAALTVVHERLSQGGRVIVHDGGVATSEASAAVDDFVGAHRDDYELSFPLRFAGHFAILRKLV